MVWGVPPFLTTFLIFILLSFVDFLHSYLLFGSIPHLPWTIPRFTFILYFQPTPSQSDLWHFRFQPFRDLLTVSATILSGGFLPTTFFTLRSFTNIFDSSCVYQDFPGSRQVFIVFKFEGLHTDPQNTDLAQLFVWFTVIHKRITALGFI